ncbi:MAG TPA: DUF4173 domain-containing protein [Patescibacteria group bacterium]|nr:DUF4173 domain-containing protein [Patescibacteria group bacterium]
MKQPIAQIRHAAKWKLATCLALALIADIFFYQQEAGWTVGGFALMVLMAVIFFHPSCLRSRIGMAATALTFGQCLILGNDPNPISLSLVLTGLITMALTRTSAHYRDALNWFERMLAFISSAGLRLFEDSETRRRVAKRRTPQGGRFAKVLRVWTLPAIMTSVFVFLFSDANPVLEKWLDAINWQKFFDVVTWQRILFWIAVFYGFWPLLRPKLPPALQISLPGRNAARSGITWLFSRESIIRSLILFNLLFAMQTVMDIVYLWNGAHLPDGMTYAQYAHRGAYPLIVTALLAAAFVLIAMRPGSDSEKSPVVHGLVYGWVAQNIFLVISSIWRTNLYMEEYSLTYLRLTALIWMGLVACGLILILSRMALAKSNRWLINMNALALAIVLYICSAANLGGIIADYNVRHCREVTGRGNQLDFAYLQSVGPAALPALEWLSANLLVQEPSTANNIEIYNNGVVLNHLRSDLQSRMTNWRAWTFQNYRISQHNKGMI